MKGLEKKHFNWSLLLGAAFLMATSSIGPGFLTQTTVFTAQFAASFGFVILASILLDIGAQLNIWRIIAVSENRAQDIANKVLPGLGYFLAFLVVLGGLAFNIGNIGGPASGLMCCSAWIPRSGRSSARWLPSGFSSPGKLERRWTVLRWFWVLS